MTRCVKKTTDGTRCKRNAEDGYKTCWQHRVGGVRVYKRRSKCKKGYRRNSSGRCVRIKSAGRKRCSPGYRRSKSGRCVRKSVKRKSVKRKSVKRKSVKRKSVKRKTPKKKTSTRRKKTKTPKRKKTKAFRTLIPRYGWGSENERDEYTRIMYKRSEYGYNSLTKPEKIIYERHKNRDRGGIKWF